MLFRSRRGTKYLWNVLNKYVNNTVNAFEISLVLNNVPDSDKARQLLSKFSEEVRAPDVVLSSDSDLQLEEEVVAFTRPDSAISQDYAGLADKMEVAANAVNA